MKLNRHIATLLLAIFLFQNCGLLIIYGVNKSVIKSKMADKLKNQKNELITIEISLKNYKKYYENTNEISINGNWYDIESAKILNDNVMLRVMKDVDEENLIADLRILNGHSKSSSALNQHNLLKLLLDSFISPNAFNGIFGEKFAVLQSNFVALKSDENLKILLPPPRV